MVVKRYEREDGERFVFCTVLKGVLTGNMRQKVLESGLCRWSWKHCSTDKLVGYAPLLDTPGPQVR